MALIDTDQLFPDNLLHGRSTVHLIVLALVWVTMALSTVVFTEPAPFDFLMIGLVFLLPVVGMAAVTPRLLSFLGVWIVIAACGFIGALYATNAPAAAMHTAITLYLSCASAVIAGFVMRNPRRHAPLIVSGLLVAAALASIAGIVGYMDIVPGGWELLTKFDRARGPFKDPNVLGAFLAPIIVMALHACIRTEGVRVIYPMMVLALLCTALLLSFSRSGWLTTFASVVLYLYLSIMTAGTNRRRMRLCLLALSGTLIVALFLIAAVQFDAVGSLLSERASVSQRHDMGPEGRFGGQIKAWNLILQNPMGIGSLEFRPIYHHEEPHNTYLAMFLNAGWVGGLLYLIVTLGTMIYGFRFVAQPGTMQGLYIVFYAGFIGTVMGGLVVDTDHWRHFYILMGVLWGFMLSPPEAPLHVPRHRTAFLNTD